MRQLSMTLRAAMLIALWAVGCDDDEPPTRDDADVLHDADRGPDADHVADGDADADADADGDSDMDGEGDALPDADTPADAELDALPDGDRADSDQTTEPLRALVTRQLFFDMPLTNGFFDPEFGQIDMSGWYAIQGEEQLVLAESVRVFSQHTPGGQPALWIPHGRNDGPIAAAGLARAPQGQAVVSVWIGRPLGGEDTDCAEVSVWVGGLFRGTGSDQAVDLRRDESTPSQDRGDLRWTRFAATMDTTPLGWSQLIVSQEVDADLYISSPVIVARPAGGGVAPRRNRALPRSLHGRESRVLEYARRRASERLSHPAASHR